MYARITASRCCGGPLKAMLLLLLLYVASATHAGANGCYDTCCFAPSCPAAVSSADGRTGSKTTGPALHEGDFSNASEPAAAAGCPAGHTKRMQSCAVPCCVPNAGAKGSCCQLGRAPGPHPNGTLAVPTEVQLAWQG